MWMSVLISRHGQSLSETSLAMAQKTHTKEGSSQSPAALGAALFLLSFRNACCPSLPLPILCGQVG